MRIVSGTLRGRPLATPKDDRTRPTSDRVREAMFNILTHGIDGFGLEGARVLDLFAGTGALGLEAISRGAQSCLFVDDGIEPRSLIRRNIETFGLAGQTRIYRRDATRLGSALPREQFDLVFADPPYGKGLGELALHSAAQGGWLVAGGLAVLEENARQTITWPDGFSVLFERTWGDTSVHFARWGAPAASIEGAGVQEAADGEGT
ncbi:MAG: 16S rRNA (guanine(966)-N(2))-methyltransferase RsmD [Hyphomicrobiaceae bacterium]